MADRAHRQTDKILEQMERELSAIYRRASKEIEKELGHLPKAFTIKADELIESIKEAETDDERKKLKTEYSRLIASFIHGKESKGIVKSIVNGLHNANIEADAVTNSRLAEIYALNYNYIGRGLKRDLSGYNFKAAPVEDVEQYAKFTEQHTKKKKDDEWNSKNVKKSFLSSGLQALPLAAIVATTAKNVTTKNRNFAIMQSRNMATDAETKGRLDSMLRADDEGFGIKKVWKATLDNRTRHAHADRDGETIPLNEEFAAGLKRPRDPNGEHDEIDGCRCSLEYDVGQAKGETRAAREGTVKGTYRAFESFIGTRSIEIENMTYKEWAKWRLK